MAKKKQIKKPGAPPEKKKEQLIQPAVPVKSKRNNPLLPYYILFGFALLLYANSLLNQYALDDRMMITENQFTKKGFDGIGEIISNDSFVGFFGKQKSLVAGGRYRPLSHVTFAIEYALFGFNPFIGHLLNIIIYAFTCLLIYRTLKMLFPPGKKQWYLTIPFIAAMLFIAHPLHTEAVTNIKGRDEIFSLLGSFGALYFVLKYVENSRPLNLVWASVVFFLGLMSKENAITFAAVIPLTLYFFTKSPINKTFSSTACLVVVSIVFILIRYNILGFFMSNKIENELLNNPFIEADTAQKYATILFTWGKYLLLLLFPYHLTHDYYPKQVTIIEMNDIRAILPLLIYAALAIYAVRGFKRKNIISYSILFFGITFSISSNLVFPIGAFMNERFMFVPLLGFCIVLAYLLAEYVPKKAVFYLAGAILLAYSVKTVARNPTWMNDYILFTTDVKVSSNSSKCNVSAGGQTLELSEKNLIR